MFYIYNAHYLVPSEKILIKIFEPIQNVVHLGKKNNNAKYFSVVKTCDQTNGLKFFKKWFGAIF